MNKISLIIQGRPVALQRHRSMIRQGKICCYDPSISDKRLIAKQIMTQLKDRIEDKFLPATWDFIEMEINFFFKWKLKCKRIESNFMNARPDLSNLIKMYEDIFQEIFEFDDKKIVKIISKKCYDENEHTEIILRNACVS